VDKLAKSLEVSYTRWGALSEEIEVSAPSTASERENNDVPAVSAGRKSVSALSAPWA
jgi:hypothetical protein